MGVFQTIEDFRGGVSRRFNDTEMFDETTWFEFLDPENALLRTEMVSLSRNIEIWRVRSSGHEIQLIEPNKVTYLLPLSGRLDVSDGEREYSAEEGNALLFSPNRRRTRVSACDRIAYEALAVLMPASNIRRIMDRQGLKWQSGALQLPTGEDRGASLRSYTLFLGDEFSRPATPLTRQPAIDGVSAVLEELVFDVASGIDASDSSEPETRSAGADYVRRAEELMWARFDEPVTIADISETLGIGVRSLQIAFHEHRGHTPREALTRIRLEEVRRRLGAARKSQNISSIAFDCGFTHLGRFSSAYRQFFGELPSETVRYRPPTA